MKTIVVGGDSWNKGFDDLSRTDDGGWVKQLSPMWYNPINLAVSGSTAKQWADDFEGRLSTIEVMECDAVVMSLGGNDLLHAIADGMLTTSEIVTMLTSINTVLTRIKCFKKRLIVILYANPKADRQDMAIGVKLLNAMIRQMAPADTEFIDCSTFLTSEDFYLLGGIHPNTKGYAKIAAEVERILA